MPSIYRARLTTYIPPIPYTTLGNKMSRPRSVTFISKPYRFAHRKKMFIYVPEAVVPLINPESKYIVTLEPVPRESQEIEKKK